MKNLFLISILFIISTIFVDVNPVKAESFFFSCYRLDTTSTNGVTGCVHNWSMSSSEHSSLNPPIDHCVKSTLNIDAYYDKGYYDPATSQYYHYAWNLHDNFGDVDQTYITQSGSIYVSDANPEAPYYHHYVGYVPGYGVAWIHHDLNSSTNTDTMRYHSNCSGSGQFKNAQMQSFGAKLYHDQ